MQVLKDLYALDDGGASLAAGTDLGSALFRMGLVHLLLAFLLALGPIRPRARAAPGSAAAAGHAPGAGDAFCASAAASVQAAAAGLPKHPPYLGYRTDIVAGAPGTPIISVSIAAAATLPVWCHNASSAACRGCYSLSLGSSMCVDQTGLLRMQCCPTPRTSDPSCRRRPSGWAASQSCSASARCASCAQRQWCASYTGPLM